MSKRFRRQTYVDSHVQGQLIKRIIFHWFAFFTVTFMCISVLQLLLGDPSKPIIERLFDPSPDYIVLAVVLISLLPAFVLDTIRFSNRFVGPIARLRRFLRGLAKGEDLPPLKFRENDFWAEAAEEYNTIAQMVHDLRAQVEALKSEKVGHERESVTAEA